MRFLVTIDVSSINTLLLRVTLFNLCRWQRAEAGVAKVVKMANGGWKMVVMEKVYKN